eukprot:1655461-Alexandrium_andersonii.AAC.1
MAEARTFVCQPSPTWLQQHRISGSSRHGFVGTLIAAVRWTEQQNRPGFQESVAIAVLSGDEARGKRPGCEIETVSPSGGARRQRKIAQGTEFRHAHRTWEVKTCDISS